MFKVLRLSIRTFKSEPCIYNILVIAFCRSVGTFKPSSTALILLTSLLVSAILSTRSPRYSPPSVCNSPSLDLRPSMSEILGSSLIRAFICFVSVSLRPTPDRFVIIVSIWPLVIPTLVDKEVTEALTAMFKRVTAPDAWSISVCRPSSETCAEPVLIASSEVCIPSI